MDRYIGLDGHSQSCTLRVLTATGKEAGHQVVETNGAALVQAVRAIPGSKHLCLEEGAQICGDRRYVAYRSVTSWLQRLPIESRHISSRALQAG